MDNPPLGPLPAEPRTRPALSRARTAVLATLREAADDGRPVTLADLAARTGSHPNTLREHLDALVADGLARRAPGSRGGRGRPAWHYTAVAEQDRPGEYAGLASSLAAAIHRTSPDPVGQAVEAGVAWGRDLARDSGARRPGDGPLGRDRAHEEVVAVLDRMGFSPRVDGPADRVAVRLTRCPLLDAARRYPDVVCGVHLGIARGALQEYGAHDSEAALTPFAEPGACLLELREPAP